VHGAYQSVRETRPCALVPGRVQGGHSWPKQKAQLWTVRMHRELVCAQYRQLRARFGHSRHFTRELLRQGAGMKIFWPTFIFSGTSPGLAFNT
jgi:hypothetical protein